MVMHPDRGIVHTYIKSYGISTRPDVPNNLTCLSSPTKYAPMDHLLGPITWNPVRVRPNIRYAYVYIYGLPTSQSPRSLCCWFNSPPILPSNIQQLLCHWRMLFRAGFRGWIDSFHCVWLDSTHLVWPHLDHSFRLGLTHFFHLVWLVFNASYLFRVTSFESSFKSGSVESHIVQGVFKIIQHCNCGIFHNSDKLNIFLAITL